MMTIGLISFQASRMPGMAAASSGVRSEGLSSKPKEPHWEGRVSFVCGRQVMECSYHESNVGAVLNRDVAGG